MQERNDYRKTLLAIFLASLAIFTTLAYVATTPRPSEEFFQIYVLGDDHRLEHYYPNDNSTINPYTTVRWYVGVTNSMASAQYAILEFKLGNASIPAPNENTTTPSPGAYSSSVLTVFCCKMRLGNFRSLGRSLARTDQGTLFPWNST